MNSEEKYYIDISKLQYNTSFIIPNRSLYKKFNTEQINNLQKYIKK